MPITKSAKKALRASKKKRLFNQKRKTEMQSAIKEYRKLVAQNKEAEAKKMLPELQKLIDKAAKRGVIKGNNAARKKSRLMKKLQAK